MIYKLDESVNSDVSKLREANKKLGVALTMANSLETELRNTNNWKGKTKEAVLDLLMLCEMFHRDIIIISERNVQNLESIIKKSDKFLQEDDIINKWRS